MLVLQNKVAGYEAYDATPVQSQLSGIEGCDPFV